MDSSVPRLRPLNLGDLLDSAIALYRRNFALFVGVVAVIAVPQAIINVIVQLAQPSNVVYTNSSGQTEVDAGRLGGFIASSLGLQLISVVFGLVITGALAQAISQRYLGESTSVGRAYATVGIGGFVTLVFASIIATIASVFGFLLLIIGFFILLIHWVFVPQAVVIERRGIFDSMRRSWDLVRGSAWRVFGIWIVLTIIVAIISAIVGGIIGIPLALFGNRAIGSAIGGAVAGLFVQPFQLGAMTLLYYDLRVRKEGFDLEVLSQSLAAGPR